MGGGGAVAAAMVAMWLDVFACVPVCLAIFNHIQPHPTTLRTIVLVD
jgi:hypothetical protein